MGQKIQMFKHGIDASQLLDIIEGLAEIGFGLLDQVFVAGFVGRNQDLGFGGGDVFGRLGRLGQFGPIRLVF